VHQLLNAVPTGTYATSELDSETIQAYSTYLHETVHYADFRIMPRRCVFLRTIAHDQRGMSA
jgi:hypothetical protein